MDRCSLGATIANGAIASRIFAPTTLKAGDRLLTLNGTPVADKVSEDVIALLRTIAPGATVAVTIEREGKSMDVSVLCGNARATHEPLLAALDLAARGRFEECMATIAPHASNDLSASSLELGCASVIRNASPTKVATLAARTAQLAIDDARYVPAMRPAVVQQLRNVEGMITNGLGPARYQQLVAATRQWPGGETAYASSGPDWALFRRNAESALRAHLIDPDSARIEWPNGFLLGTWRPLFAKPIDGYWSCGLINARNRMGGYTGTTAFVVVLDADGNVKYSEVGQAARDFDILSSTCAKSARLLPPAPPELRADATATGARNASSLADELKKLLDLLNAGALTEAEFQAAKAKLLGGTAP